MNYIDMLTKLIARIPNSRSRQYSSPAYPKIIYINVTDSLHMCMIVYAARAANVACQTDYFGGELESNCGLFMISLIISMNSDKSCLLFALALVNPMLHLKFIDEAEYEGLECEYQDCLHSLDNDV